jgi:hypothetical protein
VQTDITSKGLRDSEEDRGEPQRFKLLCHVIGVTDTQAITCRKSEQTLRRSKYLNYLISKTSMVSNSHKFFLGKNGMGLASLMKRLGRYGPGVVAVVCVECFFEGYRAKPLTVLCRHAPKGRPPHPPPRSPPPRIPRPGGLPWTAHRYWPGIIGPTWSFAMGRRFRDPKPILPLCLSQTSSRALPFLRHAREGLYKDSCEFVDYKLPLPFVSDKSKHHFVLYKLVSISAQVRVYDRHGGVGLWSGSVTNTQASA